MCLAIPAKVIALEPDDMAVVGLEGVTKRISVVLLDAVAVAVDEVPPDVPGSDRLAAEHDGGAGAAEPRGPPGSEHGELAGGDRFAVDPHVAPQRQDRELGEGRCEWDGGVGVEHDLGQEHR